MARSTGPRPAGGSPRTTASKQWNERGRGWSRTHGARSIGSEDHAVRPSSAIAHPAPRNARTEGLYRGTPMSMLDNLWAGRGVNVTPGPNERWWLHLESKTLYVLGCSSSSLSYQRHSTSHPSLTHLEMRGLAPVMCSFRPSLRSSTVVAHTHALGGRSSKPIPCSITPVTAPAINKRSLHAFTFTALLQVETSPPTRDWPLTRDPSGSCARSRVRRPIEFS